MTESKKEEKKQASDEPKNEKRRKFLLAAAGGVGVAWVGAAAYPVYKYLAPQPVPDPFGEDGKALVDKISPADVARPGTGKNGGYASRGIIVLRNGDGDLKAFDSKCTHAGCNVEFQGDKIHCNCHGGNYDLTGKNISGPPPKPLTELKVFEQDGALYVSRLEPEKKG
ncbi:MAG: ubiquinol-cytochrome c reductase iron-sulfur subunit [Deltaproteobacteria bacterium]|nr:ubiquinol-cytochrome c reductase iron-sulfur subunit [Deltaproteobacteria bacterium]MBN2671550.1 ubiquinol-cytochrome c reductase iron-sulfur subunit [Deltaproteobacteria bacterium]